MYETSEADIDLVKRDMDEKASLSLTQTKGSFPLNCTLTGHSVIFEEGEEHLYKHDPIVPHEMIP